jgi:hypothetical protein
MELKQSRYGNKMDRYFHDLIEALKKCEDIEIAMELQNKIRDMLIWRLEECEEELKYPAGRTKRFFE